MVKVWTLILYPVGDHVMTANCPVVSADYDLCPALVKVDMIYVCVHLLIRETDYLAFFDENNYL